VYSWLHLVLAKHNMGQVDAKNTLTRYLAVCTCILTRNNHQPDTIKKLTPICWRLHTSIRSLLQQLLSNAKMFPCTGVVQCSRLPLHQLQSDVKARSFHSSDDPFENTLFCLLTSACASNTYSTVMLCPYRLASISGVQPWRHYFD
jgi:hypothetical protein